MKKKVLTLCLLYQHPQILLGMKKQGLGIGRWNGFGGKVEEGEGIEEAAIREVYEEAGVTVNWMEKVGELEFIAPNRPVLEVHVFSSNDFSGEPRESEEMTPKWFMVTELPIHEMWSSDLHWYPLFLAGKKFKGRFLFDESDNVIEHELVDAIFPDTAIR